MGKESLSRIGRSLRLWLSGLTFRTGVIVGCVSAVCYLLSFAQILLPISAGAKWALWVAFFGMAKAAQYTALMIIGKEGVARLRAYFKRRRRHP